VRTWVSRRYLLAKDTLRATLLNSVLAGFTVYNTAITNLLLAEMLKKSGGNPKVDIEKIWKTSKDTVYSISNSLLEISEEHLTRREVEELKRYTDMLKELVK